MIPRLTGWLGLAFVAALPPADASADEAAWERAANAGTAAYARGAYGAAVEAFESALKQAEDFGEASWRLATNVGTMNDPCSSIASMVCRRRSSSACFPGMVREM